MVLPSAMAMVIAIAITVTMAMDIVLPDPIEVIIVNRPGVARAVSCSTNTFVTDLLKGN